MKKSAKGSKTKKSATPKAAGKKSAPKPAVAKPTVAKPAVAKPTVAKRPAKAAVEAPSAPAARYTPPPLRADGWGPFRYPPQ
jgi:hypothetical protein